MNVVVIGYGAAGAVAAITASEAGGEVLIVEKAPEAGGNSSVSSGGMRYPVDAEQTARYIKNLGLGSIDDETARVFADVWLEMKPWLERHGARLTDPVPSELLYKNLGAPEIFNIIFIESLDGYSRGCGRDFFAFLHGIVKELDVEVMLNTKAKRLIQNPTTKEIIGVIAERNGEEIYIKANQAVIITTGGFAGNPDMLSTFIEEAPVKMYPTGTPYNTGDGIRMVIDVGADLWHMNGIEWATQSFKAPELSAAHWLQPKERSWINVNRAGKRFRNETISYGHLKQRLEVFSFRAVIPDPETSKDAAESPNSPWYITSIRPDRFKGDADWPNSPWYIIFDDKVSQAGPIILTERSGGAPPFITYNEAREIYKWSQDNSTEIERNWIIKADNIEDLAQITGIDPAGLRETIVKYNEYCAKGSDPEFNRDTDSLMPINTPPYYAMECVVGIINTQGGPRRNSRSQVLSAFDGSPIPRLYAGGEFGSIWSFLYPGGFNLPECIVSGLLSGRNAVMEQPWD